MTEEIIIDGVNVAGCVDFCAEDCDCCNANNHNIGCGQYSDCYYKQLKRLEQENKELKKKIEDKPLQCLLYNNKQNKCALFTKTVAYHCALKEIREIVNQPCDNCKYNKDDITCSIGDCGEGKLKIIENKVNEVLQ